MKVREREESDALKGSYIQETHLVQRVAEIRHDVVEDAASGRVVPSAL